MFSGLGCTPAEGGGPQAPQGRGPQALEEGRASRPCGNSQIYCAAAKPCAPEPCIPNPDSPSFISAESVISH